MSDANLRGKHLYFKEIVGLRIYLALWVGIGHGLQLSGFLVPSNFLMRLLLNGHAAVVVFMIVSGFVITNLLIAKRESYSRYIVRRFFRLYPAYFLAAVLGYAVSGMWADIGQNAAYGGSPAWLVYANGLNQLHHEVTVRFWPHALLHASMLHGIVPDEILPRAAMTFLPAAWSISLEWQFYILAPLTLVAIRRPNLAVGVLTVALLMFLLYKRGSLGTYAIGSSIAGATPYFIVGIVSRLAYNRLMMLTIDPLVAVMAVIILTVTLLNDPLPLAVWGIFLSVSLWHGGRPALSYLFTAIFKSRLALLLGEASFSLYLLHRPAQVVLGYAAISFGQISQREMFIVQLVAIAVAIPLSIASYFFIERPGIRLGARLANLLPSATPKTEPSPAPIDRIGLR